MIYQSLLALHIACFTIAIGTLVSSLATYNQFWKLYSLNSNQGNSAFRFFLKTRKVGMFGLFFAILAGLSMELIAGGSHTHYLWFKIKMCLIICIFINGFTIGRIFTLGLQRLFDGVSQRPFSIVEIDKLKRGTHIFQYTQLLIYFLIIIMAAFRFS
jgi:hypothetical protein